MTSEEQPKTSEPEELPVEKLEDPFYDEDELREHLRRGGTYHDFFNKKDKQIYNMKGRIPPSVIFAGIVVILVVAGSLFFLR
jgi:hypothetical protein